MPPLLGRRLFGYVVMVSAMVLIVVIFVSGPLKAGSQQVSGAWQTLAGNPYRTAFVGDLTGNIVTPSEKWRYIPTGYYAIYANPIIVDLDGSGTSEVVVVDSSGRLSILDGQSGTLLNQPDNDFYNLAPFSTPAVGDLDNDNQPELVAGTKDGYIVAIDIETTTWSTSLLWRSPRLDSYIDTSPLIGDFDNDVRLEIVVSTRFGLVCLDGVTGRIEWKTPEGGLVFVTSPALTDNFDGYLGGELVYVDGLGKIYIYNGTGYKVGIVDLWGNANLSNTTLIIHSPISADIDGDSVLEVIVSIGREIFASEQTRQGFEGYIAVLNFDSNSPTMDLVSAGQGALFAWFSQPALAAADTDGDGRAEIFVGSADGNLYRIDEEAGTYTVSKLAALDTYWPQQGASTSALAVAVADIYPDTTNRYEVVAISTYYSGGVAYNVYCIDVSTGSILWQLPLSTDSYYYTKFTWPTVMIGDVDGDSALEIIVSAFNYISCIDDAQTG